LEEQRPEPLLEDTFEAELAKALQEEAETKRIETTSPEQIPESEEEDLRFDFEEGPKAEPQSEQSPASPSQREATKTTAETVQEPDKPPQKREEKWCAEVPVDRSDRRLAAHRRSRGPSLFCS
jgi:hypothetical protein